MRGAFVLIALMAAACGPRAESVTETVVSCDEVTFSGTLHPTVCTLDVGGETLRATYAQPLDGVRFGNISVDVLGEDGAVRQTMLEPEVVQYFAPLIQDIDGDGRADILIPREGGNVNFTYGVWVFSGERGVYERLGDVTGVDFDRTSDGLVAVSARSSAVEWAVAFFKLDEGGLHPMVTVRVTAPREDATAPSCVIDEAPGLRDLNLTQEEAQGRFCAEPAAQVFEP